MTARPRYAIDIAPLGDLSDPAAIVRLAVAAERAGWDGVSTWDVLGTSLGTTAPDPFVTLAAIASATERLSLIASVIVLPRRRPQLVAQAASTIDRLSGGRLVLGVGVGADPLDFSAFGEAPETAARIALFDEGVELVDAFLRGETVEHEGPGYVVRGAAVAPRSPGERRIPIWMGGMKPGALRRAARRDGWVAFATSKDGSEMALSPDAFRVMVAQMERELVATGRSGTPFDIALFGTSDPSEPEAVRSYVDAGATWWLESLSPLRASMEGLLARVGAGPPR